MMRMPRAVAVAFAGLAVFLSAPYGAAAHHASAAEFDGSKPVKLQGTITKVEWINPHAWIHIDVRGADGTVVSWKVEGGSPNVLLRRGMNPESLKPGMVIVVEGALAKDGTPKVNGRNVTFPDGRKLFLQAATQ